MTVTYAELKKYNLNHDPRTGRFAPNNGGNSVSAWARRAKPMGYSSNPKPQAEKKPSLYGEKKRVSLVMRDASLENPVSEKKHAFDLKSKTEKSEILRKALSNDVPDNLNKNSATQKLVHHAGLNDKPTKLSNEEYNSFDGKELYRGVKDAWGMTGREINEMTRSGDATFIGNGKDGDGIYFASNMDKVYGGDIMKAKLKKNAKIADANSLRDSFWEEVANGDSIASMLKKPSMESGEWDNDLGAYALTKCYDAISSGNNINILNRGALVVPETAEVITKGMTQEQSEKLAWAFNAMFFEEEKPVKKAADFHIAKADEDQRLVFGWASVARTADGQIVKDWQDDTIEPEEMEKAAYEYVLKFRATGERHNPALRNKGRLVESVVLTKEKQAAMGIPDGYVDEAWWVGFYIDDDKAWEGIKKGEYEMFSIEGQGKREKLEKQKPLTYSELKKYNDAHDPKTGRFTFKNGGSSSSGNIASSRMKDSDGNKLSESQAAYFAGSKAVDEDGNLVKLYHGTVSDFTVFDSSYGNPENDMGVGIYLSNSRTDSEANYGDKQGADLRIKIERMAERLENEGMEWDEAEQAAEELFITAEPHTLECYVNMKNPVVLGGDKSKATFFDFEEPYDPDTDEYGEPTGKLFEFTELLYETVSDGKYECWEPDRFMEEVNGQLYGDAFDYGGLNANAVIQTVKEIANNYEITTSNRYGDGYLAGGELARDVLEQMGYDGIIDNTVSDKFRNMKGMNKGTAHYIVFNSNQVKITSNMNPTDDADITKCKAFTYRKAIQNRKNCFKNIVNGIK